MWNFKKQSYKTLNVSTPIVVSCDATVTSGGVGITEFVIPLDKPLGGIVVMDFSPQGVPDKLEIIHDGIKKATSGMTVSNSGPFDNIYGDPRIPNVTQANVTDQFIGSSKGAVPTRDSIFLSETGITDIVRTRQQLIWFVYSNADYNVSNFVIVRVTGIVGTAWDLQRLCTDQIPSGITPSEEITIVSSISTVEQCGAGDDTKIVTSSITLSSAVTVDTIFTIETIYSINGSCTTGLGSVFTNVTILSGEISGDSLGCGSGSPSFPSDITAVICSESVVSHNNTVDNIII